MTRGLHADIKTAAGQRVIKHEAFVKAEFDSGDVCLWTGLGDYVLGGDTYTGAGDLLSISQVSETSKIEAVGSSITVNGLNSALLSLALDEPYRGRPLTLRIGLFDENEEIIASPFVLFEGYMDQMPLKDSGESFSINVNSESKLRDLFRKKSIFWTDQDQKTFYDSDDNGCEWVAGLANKEIVWGR